MNNIFRYKKKFKATVGKLFTQYPYMFEEQELAIISKDLRQDGSPGYPKLVYTLDNQIVGFIGATIPRDSTHIWQLTWQVVHPNYHHQGIGSKLVNHLEQEISKLSGHTIFVETGDSSDPLSIAAKNFYHKNGYRQVGLIPNYWGKDDGKVIFYKELL